MYPEIRNLKHARQDRADIDAKIQRLRADGRALLGKVGTKLTPEQEAAVAAKDGQITELTSQAADVAAEIARMERAQQEEFAAHDRQASRIERPATGRRFAQMFPSVAIDMGGFSSPEEFLATLHGGLADPRLVATMTESVDSSGGFSVPTQIFEQWLDSSLESEIVRPRADVRPMTSSDAKGVGWDDGDRSSTLFGGFTGQWIPETGEITETQGKLQLINLHARKLAILTRVSNELLADGMSFDAQLGQAITKALGYFLDRAFLTGAGASAPLGVLGANCTISVDKETSQPAATIAYANIVKMFARMLPSSLMNAVWIANSATIPQLLTLSIPMGTAGAHVPVLSESGGQFTMLTRPVIFTDKVPTLGTVGDLMFCDLSQYIVGLRAGFTLAKSAHVGFATDTSHYRGIIRVDGQPKLRAPVQPANGPTQSPFVVLATRA